MKRINSFVEMCVEKDYVSQERAAWLQYALEKRIVTVLSVEGGNFRASFF